MSKLSEALQRKRRGEGARVMGFGARATEKDRALLLGVLGASASEAAEATAAQATGWLDRPDTGWTLVVWRRVTGRITGFWGSASS